jgi:predicted RNA-binding Zn-ribbon protein involved in translation (DUF1610 family)
MSGITLHPQLGVNPHLMSCPRCGGNTNGLMLIGDRTTIRECDSCGVRIYGHRPSEPCPKCGQRSSTAVGKIGEHKKLVDCQPCDGCQAELKEHRRAVEAGGVYFKCADCGVTGVIKGTSPLAKAARKQMKIPKPGLMGVEFTKVDCPACGPDKVV